MAITLRKDNPYATGIVLNFKDGKKVLEPGNYTYIESPGDVTYIIKESDNLSDLAFSFYGNSKYWWVIGKANDIEFPFELTVGQNIIIPDKNRL